MKNLFLTFSLFLFTFSLSLPAATVNDYVKDGLVLHFDAEYNQGAGQAHDASATTWKDLVSGLEATAVAQSGVYPRWGVNDNSMPYACMSNTVDGVTAKQTYFSFTPSEAVLAAVNSQPGNVTAQACGKVRTWVSNISFWGFTTPSNGKFGLRCDSGGNSFFRMRGSGEWSCGNAKTAMCAGVVDTVSIRNNFARRFLNTTSSMALTAFTPGSVATTGGGVLGSRKYLTTDADMELYAVRLYSRGLYPLELLHNAEVDRVRYFGDAARTTKRVDSYNEPYSTSAYGTVAPGYQSTKSVAAGAAQQFSVSGLTTYDVDDAVAYRVSDVERAVYEGVSIVTLASDGAKTTTDYASSVTSVDATVNDDTYAIWKWRKQFALKIAAGKGGKVQVNSAEGASTYENWYDATAAAEVSVTAVPDEGYAFVGWSGDVAGLSGGLDEASQTVPMSQGRQLAATFTRTGKGDGSTYVWTGGAADGDFLNAANWDRGDTPLEDDVVVVSPAAATEITLSSTTPRYASITLGGGAGKVTLYLQNWDTALNADSVTVGAKGVLTVPSYFLDTEMSNRVYVTCRDFTLEAGGAISMNGKGWRCKTSTSVKGAGPGGGYSNRGGASHGGYGGLGYGFYSTPPAIYGSVEAPLDPGSGGGRDGGGYNDSLGHGGGAVRIAATGAVRLWGTIKADGFPGQNGSITGGGSGGSIYISSGTFDGTNVISACGGRLPTSANHTGGGGGGRISITWTDTAAQALLSPTPTILCSGRYFGQSSYPATNPLRAVHQLFAKELGEEGTVYLTDSSFYPGTIWTKCTGRFTVPGLAYGAMGDVTFAAETSDNSSKIGQDALVIDQTLSFGTLTLGKYSHLVLSNCTVTAASIAVASGCLELKGHSTLTVSGDVTVSGTGVMRVWAGPTNGVGAATWDGYGAKVAIAGRLALEDTAILYSQSEGMNGGSPYFELGALSVASGATVNGVGRGWGWMPGATNHNGHGPGHPSGDAGGSYGGKGGSKSQNSIGKTYGDAKNPLDPGSSGNNHGTVQGYYGGYGGGLFRALVTGRVTVDGAINMNGWASGDQGGGGSGGAVNLRCAALAGAGSITADGGNGGQYVNYSGPGGGGRIAIVTRNRDNWTGSLSAVGAANYTYSVPATDGTVYTKLTGGMMVILR